MNQCPTLYSYQRAHDIHGDAGWCFGGLTLCQDRARCCTGSISWDTVSLVSEPLNLKLSDISRDDFEDQ